MNDATKLICQIELTLLEAAIRDTLTKPTRDVNDRTDLFKAYLRTFTVVVILLN